MEFSKDVFRRYLPRAAESREDSSVQRLLWGEPVMQTNPLLNMIGVKVDRDGKFVSTNGGDPSSSSSSMIKRTHRRPQSARPAKPFPSSTSLSSNSNSTSSSTAATAAATSRGARMVLRKQRQLEQTQKAKQSKSSKHRSLNHRRRTPNAENSMPMGNHATIRPRSAQLARSSAPTPGMTMAQIVRQDRDRAAAVAEKENRRVGAEEEPWAYPEASFETDAERELFRLKVDNLVQKEVTRKRDTVEFERTAKEQAEQKHVMHFVKELSLKVMHNEHKVAATKTLLEHRADRLGALEDALEDAHADTETLRVALRERETHAAKLTIDLELEQDTTGRFERQTAKLTSQIEVLTLKDRNQTDKLATLAEEHNALRDNHAQLQSNALTYSTRNEKLDSELLAARNTLATHDATIAQLTAQVKTLVQKLAAVEKANADLTDRLNHGKSKLSELQYIQTTYDYIKGQYDVQYAELEQIKRVMAAQENEIETRLGALREQEEVNVRSSASVQLRKCQIQLKAAQAQAEQLRTDIVQHDISFQAKHRTLIEKATKYDLFYDKYVKCAARQPRLERELKTAKSQLVSTRKALEKTKDQLEDQKTVTQRFRTRSLKIESLHTVAKNHSTVLERRVSELLVTIERMKMDSKSRGGQQSALTDSLNTQLHEISHKYLATQTEISRLQENSRVVTREKVGLEALVQQYREGQLQDMQLVEERNEARKDARNLQLRLEYFEMKGKGLRTKLEANDSLMHDTLSSMDAVYALLEDLRYAAMLHANDDSKALGQGLHSAFCRHVRVEDDKGGDDGEDPGILRGKADGRARRNPVSARQGQAETTEEQDRQMSSDSMVELVNSASQVQISLLEKEKSIQQSRGDLMKMREGASTISNLKNQVAEVYSKHEDERKQWKAHRAELENEIQFLQTVHRGGTRNMVSLDVVHEQHEGPRLPPASPRMRKSPSNASIGSAASEVSSLASKVSAAASSIIQDDGAASLSSKLQAKKLEHTVTTLMRELERQSHRVSDLEASLDASKELIVDVTAQRNAKDADLKHWQQEHTATQERLALATASLLTRRQKEEAEAKRKQANAAELERIALASGSVSLGVKYRDVNGGMGVRVTTVVPNSSAEFGLRVGDIITGILRPAEGKQRAVSMSADIIEFESSLVLGEECFFLVTRAQKDTHQPVSLMVPLFIKPFGQITKQQIQALLHC